MNSSNLKKIKSTPCPGAAIVYHNALRRKFAPFLFFALHESLHLASLENLLEMADLNAKWNRFKGEMKAKRMAKPINKAKKESGHGQKELNKTRELTVQQLSSHVSGKAQKYSRVGPREFVPYPFDELSFNGIKAACLQHFSSKTGLECDVLAGERGPSCKSLEQIPDLKLIHIRFIPTVFTGELDLEPFIKKYKVHDETDRDKTDQGGSAREIFSKDLSIPCQIKEVKSSTHGHSAPSTKVTNTTVKSRPVPKSMSVTQMLKMGKGKTNTEVFSLVNIFKFDLAHMTWSIIPQKIELSVELEPFSCGGFRKAYKATSITPGFCDTKWVIKRYLPEALETIQTVGQTVEEHTKKAIQTHLLAKNFAEMLDKEVSQWGIAGFGRTLRYNKIYLGKFEASGESTTIEEFIEGDFKKYINNTGITYGESSDVAEKAVSCTLQL